MAERQGCRSNNNERGQTDAKPERPAEDSRRDDVKQREDEDLRIVRRARSSKDSEQLQRHRKGHRDHNRVAIARHGCRCEDRQGDWERTRDERRDAAAYVFRERQTRHE